MVPVHGHFYHQKTRGSDRAPRYCKLINAAKEMLPKPTRAGEGWERAWPPRRLHARIFPFSCDAGTLSLYAGSSARDCTYKYMPTVPYIFLFRST